MATKKSSFFGSFFKKDSKSSEDDSALAPLKQITPTRSLAHEKGVSAQVDTRQPLPNCKKDVYIFGGTPIINDGYRLTF